MPQARGGTAIRREQTWLVDQERSLLAHVHLPADGRARGAVVIADSFGRDRIVAVRAMAALADTLAQSGLVAVRFDWSGTANSGPRPSGSAPAAACVADLDLVLDLVRDTLGQEAVTLVGHRMGVLLAAEWAHSRPEGDETLVLWDPPRSGRSWLRAFAAVHRMSHEAGMRGVHVPPAAGATETPGRLFTKEESQDFGRLTPTVPATAADRTHFLVRDGDAPPATPEGQPTAHCHTIHGQESFVDQPSALARVPRDVIALIQNLCATGQLVTLPQWEPTLEAVVGTVRVRGTDHPLRERIVRLEGCHGIVTDAIGTSRLSQVLFAGGCEPLEGPTGLWVSLARSAAARGVSSLRTDLPGSGEQVDTGVDVDRTPYSSERVTAATAVVGAFARLTGAEPVLTGLCAGAWMASEVATRRPTPLVIGINQIYWSAPEVADSAPPPAEVDAEALVPDTGSGDLSHRLRQLVKHRAPYPALLPLARRGAIEMAEPLFAGLVRQGTTVHQIFSVGDYGYWLQQRGRNAHRRLLGRGSIDIEVDRYLDHSLMADAGRCSTSERVLALLTRAARGGTAPGRPD